MKHWFEMSTRPTREEILPEPCRTSHGAQHKTQSDFWDSIRIKPIIVPDIEDRRVTYQFDDTHTIVLASVYTDEMTKGKPVVGRNYILLYGDEHKVAYEFINR